MTAKKRSQKSRALLKNVFSRFTSRGVRRPRSRENAQLRLEPLERREVMATVQFYVPQPPTLTVGENSGGAGFLVGAFSIAAEDVQLRFSGTATRGLDYDVYVATPGGPELLEGDTVTTPPGFPWIIPNLVGITIVPRQDAEVEVAEEVVIEMQTDGGHTLGGNIDAGTGEIVIRNQVSVWITDALAPDVVICNCDCGCQNKTTADASQIKGSPVLDHNLGSGQGLSSNGSPQSIVRGVALASALYRDAPGTPAIYHYPTSAQATLNIHGPSGVVTTTQSISGGGGGSGWLDKAYEFAFQPNVSGLPTGLYEWDMDVDFTVGGVTFPGTGPGTSGRILVMNTSGSDFGDSWGFDGVDDLRIQTGSVPGALLTDSKGRVRWFAASGTSFDKAPGDDSRAQLTADGAEYVLTDKFGTVTRYESTGTTGQYRVQSRTDSNGNQTLYSYSSVGKLVEIIDARQQSTTFEYDVVGADRTIEITEPGGAVTRLLIDGTNNKLLSITSPDPDGGANPLVSPVTVFGYGSGGQVSTVTKGTQSPTLYNYSSSGFVESMENPDGSIVEIESYAQRRLGSTSLVEAGQYAPGEDEAVVTNELLQTRITKYDSYGLVISEEIVGLGTRKYERSSDGAVNRFTDIDPDGDLGPLDPPVTEYQYDVNKNLIGMILPGGGERVWSGYTFGKPGKFVDEYGRTTIYDYDIHGNVESERVVVDGTDLVAGDNDATTTYTYSGPPASSSDLPGGLVLTMTDPNGNVTQYEYYEEDSEPTFGLLKTIIHPGGATTEYEYDAAGNVTKVKDEAGRYTHTTYDNLGRVTSVSVPTTSDSSVGLPVTSYTYYRGIKLAAITEPDPDGAGPLVSKVTTFDYDEGDTLVTVTETGRTSTSDPIVRTYKYDPLGNLLWEEDPFEKRTTYDYDAHGRLESVTQPVTGGTINIPAPVTSYTYDNLGRLMAITGPSSITPSDPVVNEPVADVSVTSLVPWTRIDLVDPVDQNNSVFADDYDAPSSLRYEIIEVDYASATIFDSLLFDPENPGRLILTYAAAATGSATITVRATNSYGESAQEEFTVTRSAAPTTEAIVNTTTSGTQQNASIEALSNGNYVIVWEGNGGSGSDTDTQGVFFALYAPNDTVIIEERLVNQTNKSGVQSQPKVAADHDGGFAITWSDQSTSNTKVWFRVYDSTGTATTDELLVSENGDSTEARPDIAYASYGPLFYYVVVWQGSNTGDGAGIFAQGYVLDSWTGVFLVNEATTGTQQHPSIAATDGGGFTIAWETPSGTGSGVFLRHYTLPFSFSATSAIQLGVFVTSYFTESYAVLADGGVAVAWRDQLTGFPAGAIIAQAFGADGTPAGPMKFLEYADKPAITATANGFAVGWIHATNGARMARFTSTGDQVGSYEDLDNASYPASDLSLTGAKDGRILAAWSASVSGSSEVYRRVFAATSVTRDVPLQVSVDPGRTVLGPVDQIILTFSEGVSSVIAGKITVARLEGGSETSVPIASVTPISARQALVKFTSPRNAAGQYVVRVLPDVVTPNLDQDADGTVGEATDDKLVALFAIAAVPSTATGEATYEYDALDRVVQETDPAGAITTYVYAAGPSAGHRTVTMTVDPSADPDDELTTIYEYDQLDRLVRQTLPDATAPTRVYRYDPAGNLVEEWLEEEIDEETVVSNRRGYAYDNRNRLWKTYERPDAGTLFDSYGDPLATYLAYTYTYTGTGEVATITDPRGALTTYTYDAFGNVLQEALPDPDTAGVTRTVTSYVYDDLGRLLKKIEADNSPFGFDETDYPVTEYAYDNQGNLIQITAPHPDAANPGDRPVQTFTYDDAGRLASSTDGMGHTTTYLYDDLGRVIAAEGPELLDMFDLSLGVPVTRYEYDAVGNLLRETDPLGNVTEHRYDSASRRVATIDALGSVTTYAYNGFGQLVAETDALGRVTRYEYDVWGNVSAVIGADPDGLAGDDESPRTEYVYNAAGLLVSMSDPLGNETKYAYDQLNRLVVVTNVLSEEDDAETKYTYDQTGNLLSETDPEERITRYTYDLLGQRITMMTPDPAALGGTNGPVTNYAYDERGRLIEEKLPDPNTLGGTNRPATNYTYDDVGRLIKVEEPDPDGVGGLPRPTTTYEYDANGRLTGMVNPTQNVEYAYDELGNLLMESDTLGGAFSYYTRDLNGQAIIEYSDSSLYRTIHHYDRLGRLTDTTDPRQGATQFQYDRVGNRTAVIDAVGNWTASTYDGLNRLVRELDPLGKAATFQYDAAGNRTEIVNRRGETRTFFYDKLNRLVEEKWGGVSNTTFTYDLSGRILTADNPAASYDYDYDLAGRLQTVTNTLTGMSQAVTLDQEHDYLGRRTELSATIGSTLDFQNVYEYDPLSRLKKVTQDHQTGGNPVAEKRVDLTYNAGGQTASITRFKALSGGSGNQVVTSAYTYNSAHQLSQLANTPTGGHNSTWQWNYTAGELGAPAGLVSQFISNGVSTYYKYDALSQLIYEGATAVPPDQSYTYDLNGNRRDINDELGPGNQFLSNGDVDYAFDEDGNRTDSDALVGVDYVYQWDARNRLIGVTVTDGVTTTKYVYAYDAFDRRVFKGVDLANDGDIDSAEYYVWDQDHPSGIPNVVLDFVDADGQGVNPATLKMRYLHGNAVDQVFAQENLSAAISADARVYWLLQDNLGSVRDVVNNAGNVIDRINYDAFGNILSSVNPNASNAATALATRFLFTGQEWDADAHLYYYNARWYDPATGTFISKDPLGFEAGDLNLYRYVGNSPTNFVDPTGHWGEQGFWEWLGSWISGFDPFAPRPGYKKKEPREPSADSDTRFQRGIENEPHVTSGMGPRLDNRNIRNNKLSSEMTLACGQAVAHVMADLAMTFGGGKLAGSAIEVIAQGGRFAVKAAGRTVRIDPKDVEGIREALKCRGASATDDDIAKELQKRIRDRLNSSGKARSTGFDSFDALKRALGPAGERNVYHHIVEQRAANVGRFGAETIHNTNNVVIVSREVNQAIANYYSSIRPFTNGQTVRQWLNSMSFEEQRRLGARYWI